MIYPELLPDNVKSEAEKKVFSAFKEIENEYDIFYGKRFSGILNVEVSFFNTTYFANPPVKC